jgi:hypothetical protein
MNMKSVKMPGKFFSILILICLLVQTFACGTLIYPERRGQKEGRIDIHVAILDGLGLLLFIIPGVIAYAVDFSTGAIFLPGGKKSSPVSDGIKTVKVDPSKMDEKGLVEIVSLETGIPAPVLKKAQVYALNGNENIRAKLIEIKKAGYQPKE